MCECNWFVNRIIKFALNFVLYRRITRDFLFIVPSTTTTANSYTSSTTTQTISMDPFCAENATWKNQGVTVAGSSNGMNSSSLTDLNIPRDVIIDTSGNLFISDCSNYRVVYWPINATAGRMVAGTGVFSSWFNSFKCPAGIIGKNQIEINLTKKKRKFFFDIFSLE